MRAERSRPSDQTGAASEQQQLGINYVCPACGALAVGGLVTHAETCPMSTGVDRVLDADAAWFRAHPWASEYYRPVEWAERVELGLPATGGRMLVLQLAPGVRSRQYVPKQVRHA